jgi:hypothetical protein
MEDVWELAGHMGIIEFIKVREGNYKRGYGGNEVEGGS